MGTRIIWWCREGPCLVGAVDNIPTRICRIARTAGKDESTAQPNGFRNDSYQWYRSRCLFQYRASHSDCIVTTPEVMQNDFTGADRVYIACGKTDLRKGIDGLAAIVQQQFSLNPFTNTLFLFCGGRRDRIKGLYWETDGFILLYKRLEKGTFQWARKASDAKSLTLQQYRWLMKGLSVEQPKAHQPVTEIEEI